MMLTHHVPVSMQAVTGIIADGRQIVNRAHDEAVQYKKCAFAPKLTTSTAVLYLAIAWRLIRIYLHGGQLLRGQHTWAGARRQSSELRPRLQPVLVCKVGEPGSPTQALTLR